MSGRGFSIEQFGGEALKQTIDAGIAGFGLELKKKMRGAVGLLWREARKNARTKMKSRSGRLQRAIGTRITGSVQPMKVEIEGRVGIRGARQFYRHLETGGQIEARKMGRKALASRASFGGKRADPDFRFLIFPWAGARAGTWTTIRKVEIEEHPFLAPAMATKGAAAVAILGESFGIYTAKGGFR
jgi:hypothetical protein